MLVRGERVELNALTSDALVALIERKLNEHGITKVIPSNETLADAYRRLHKQAVIQDKIDELIEDLDEAEVKVPPGLRQRIKKVIKADPARPWDAIVREIVEEASQP